MRSLNQYHDRSCTRQIQEQNSRRKKAIAHWICSIPPPSNVQCKSNCTAIVTFGRGKKRNRQNKREKKSFNEIPVNKSAISSQAKPKRDQFFNRLLAMNKVRIVKVFAALFRQVIQIEYVYAIQMTMASTKKKLKQRR